MRIYELDVNKRAVFLEGPLTIKETEILERVEGDIFRILSDKVRNEVVRRLDTFKKEPNTIAMSNYLYQYLKYIFNKNKNRYSDMGYFTENNTKKLFDLNIVIRDDYDIDEIDIYRDITNEVK